MERQRKKWLILVTLLVIAAATRIAVAHYLPNDAPDDGRVYAQIARNVLEQHVYSHATEPPYEPTIIRLPGYPLFLAAVYSVFGHTNNGAVRIAQALVDTATCALVALLAFYWQPDEERRFRTAIAALCLAALCPFTMIYAATILTEVPAMFLVVAMCLAATIGIQRLERGVEEGSFNEPASAGDIFVAPGASPAEKSANESGSPRAKDSLRHSLAWWAIAGLFGGLAVLLRPDSGLFAAAVGITLILTRVGPFWSAVAGAARHRFGSFPLSHWERVQARGAAALKRTSPHPNPPPSGEGAEHPKRHRRLALPAHSKKYVIRTLTAGAIFSFAFILVLVPWTIRSARVFHLFQPLAPAHAEMPGEFVPRGYSMWLRTWLDDERYIGPFLWALDTEPIKIDHLPPQAFDSKEEKARVATLLERYNHPPDTESPTQSMEEPKSGSTEAEENNQGDEGDNSDEADQEQTPDQISVEMTPEVDAGFAQLARERIAHHPFRYYVWLPVKRAGTMWFNTHSQYWPWDGELFPLADLDHDTHQQYWLPLFAGLTWIYTLLGLAGGWVLWRARKVSARRWLLLVSLVIVLRLSFFSTLENPEPRYVVEFFPFLAALGGIAIARFIPIGLGQL